MASKDSRTNSGLQMKRLLACVCGLLENMLPKHFHSPSGSPLRAQACWFTSLPLQSRKTTLEWINKLKK